MIILGLNAFHGDSAAALVRDGKLVAAAEEERFRRVKHWAGFPSQAIAYCLREAASRCPTSTMSRSIRTAGPICSESSPIWRRSARISGSSSAASRIGAHARTFQICCQRAFPARRFRGEVHQIEHHLAHLSSAFHVSPFEEAVVVSVDGFGDFASAAWGVGKGKDISIDGRVYFPHSLGIFYQALTQYLGFPALRRRIQGHGPRALRQAGIHGCHAQDRAA